jgi:hypothetical protein
MYLRFTSKNVLRFNKNINLLIEYNYNNTNKNKNNNNNNNIPKKIIGFSIRKFAVKIDLDKDYYKILGLSPNATEKDIKNAYLKCVKVYHPDLNNGKTTEVFKEIKNSFEILSDPEKKGYYDSNSFNSSEYNFQYSSFDQKAKKPKENQEDFQYDDFDFENRHKFYGNKKHSNREKDNNNNNYNETNINDYKDKGKWNMAVYYFYFTKELIENNLNFRHKILIALFLFSIYEIFLKKEKKLNAQSCLLYYYTL